MRSIRFVVAALAAAGLAITAASAAQADPVKIRTSYVVPVANWASLLLEKPELLKHQGKSYVTEAIRFQGTPPMITALAAGEIEIGDLGYSSLAFAIQNAGLSDLRVIGDDFQDGVTGYYSDQFFVLNDSGIKTVEDLKGKVVATNAGGSAVDIAMRAMLRKHHLDDKKDVTFVEAAFPNMKSMLESHKVDLIPGVPPFAFNPDLNKEAHALFVQKDAVGTTQMIVWTARAGFIQKHRAAMVDFMEDSIRVARWYLDPKNHDEVVAIAAKLTKTPPALWQDWVFTKKDDYRSRDMQPDLKALQANVETQQELGFLNTKIDIGKYSDLSLAKEAAARLK